MSIQAENRPLAQFRAIAPLLQSGKKFGWLSLLLWLTAITPAHAAELEMRVAVEQDVSQIQVGSSTNAVLRDATGRELGRIPAQQAVVAQASQGQVAVSDRLAEAVWVEPSGDGLVWIGSNWYRGRTRVVPTAGGLTAVNYVDLEDYLYSVVGSEVYTNWQPEALKAQAVAARTYALYQRNTGANAVFDVGDTERWQVYKGVAEEAPSTIAAVEATRGQVVTYQGQIINAVFHACAGGSTENVEDVWTRPLAYLRAVPDFDQGVPNCEWTETFTADQLRSLVPGIGNIRSFVPERTTPAGRIITMRVNGDDGSKVVSGNELRSGLRLRSTLITSISAVSGQVSSTRGLASAAESFEFRGRGNGHGLGMSQWGAQNLALQGRTYQDILRHYYSGTTLARIQVQ